MSGRTKMKQVQPLPGGSKDTNEDQQKAADAQRWEGGGESEDLKDLRGADAAFRGDGEIREGFPVWHHLLGLQG